MDIAIHEKNHFPKDKCFKFGNYNFILWLVWWSGQFFNLGLYINNTFHLAQKYARIFARGHYLLREANSFLRVYLKENCEFLGTDYVQGQIFKHIFAPNGGYCVYYSSNLFLQCAQFQKLGNILRYSVVLAVNIWSHDIVKPIGASKNIWWTIMFYIPTTWRVSTTEMKPTDGLLRDWLNNTWPKTDQFD